MAVVLLENCELQIQSLTEAIELLETLNGADISWMSLIRAKDELLIAGGRDGWYQVLLTCADGRHQYDGFGRHEATGEIRMVTGGQGSIVPLQHCATRDATIAAIQEFLTTGRRSAALNWRQVF